MWEHLLAPHYGASKNKIEDNNGSKNLAISHGDEDKGEIKKYNEI